MEQAGIAYATDQIIDLLDKRGEEYSHLFDEQAAYCGKDHGKPLRGDPMLETGNKEMLKREAVRYLGYGRHAVDEQTSA